MNREARDFLRHTVATLAYRCGKTLWDVPENFKDGRSRIEINFWD